MIRMLHLADLHLGWTPSFLGEKVQARQQERDGLLRRAVRLVLEEKPVDVVVIAGDLFETHTPPDALVQSVLADLARLVAAGIHVITVPGNHDEITYPDSVYRRHGSDWPGLLIQNPMPDHAATLDVDGTALHVYGMAYTGGLTDASTPLTQFPRKDEAGFHVAVFHGTLDWNPGERSLPLSSEALAGAGYDYVALGHIHQHIVRNAGRGKAVYPGAVEGKGFGDPGTGRFCFVTLDEDGARIEQVEAGSRPVREEKLDVTDLDDEQSVADQAAATADEEAIVRLRLVGAAPRPLSTAALEERLRDKYFYVEIVDETVVFDEGTLEDLAAEPTVRGMFVRRMKEGMAAAADEDERRLWRAALRRGLTALEGSGL